MLISISISKLFTLYSYYLDLKTDESKVCFITGPNGYGKTSILNILHNIYSRNWERLSRIPFDSISLTFSDNVSLSITQNRNDIQDEESDEKLTENVSLEVKFQLTSEDIYTYQWSEDSRENIKEDKNIQLFFESHPIYFIRDGRLNAPDHIPTIARCVEKMKTYLRDYSLSESPQFQEKINVFKKIITSSDFANKTLQFDARYGFRFILNNEDKTILSPESLSSGEQHLTVMAFELLFRAPDDSLVLIDEPEISFHMLWQIDFLKNLDLILSSRKLQCIVATHSPQIFNMKWNLSVDLFNQQT